jgi:Nif-specific regulatory protein
MNPKLLALSGPLKGSVIPLGDTPFSIGRESSTRLRLRSPGVSRQHCVIERDAEDRFWLTDLGSRNGTFVNGVPRSKGELRHGDQIRVGESYLLLSLHDSELSQPHDIIDFDAEAVTGSLAEVSPEATLYLDRQGLAPKGLTAQQVLDDMRALIELSTAVNTTRDVKDLQGCLLESLFKTIPADRGAVLLTADGSEEPASVVGRDRHTGQAAPVTVSRSIVQKVLSDGQAVLNNAIEDDTSGSLADADVRSVIAAPLVARGKTLGAIYLYSCDPEIRFTDGHLQLLTAMAGIAAMALDNARHAEVLETDRKHLLSEIKIEHNMVGESDALHHVHDFIGRVAPTDATVLIAGESGTGKELVARAIHWNSLRAKKPFVAFNCAALVENLLESEMFGHQRGAFTGAIAQKQGKFEIANGGTIFLDEIGELAHPLQAKLLRVLQEKEFERVGGTHPIKADARVIAACSRELQDLVKEGKFREDLFYRLNVVSVVMPPLRERHDDIPLLAMYFTSKFATQCHRSITEISPAALESLQSYSWPGNVRELENAIERAVVLGSGDVIRPEDLPESVMEAENSSGGPVPRYHEAIVAAKREVVLRAFQEAEGDHLKAAQMIDVHPNYLYRLIRNMNLKPDLNKKPIG